MEEKIKNLKVREKLQYAFVAMMMLFGIAIICAVACLGLIVAQMNNFYKTPYVNSTLQMEIRKDVQMVSRQLLWSMATDNRTETEEHLSEAEKYSAKITENMEKLGKNFDNKELNNRLAEAMEKLKTERAKVIQYSRSQENDKALNLINGSYNNAFEEVQNTLLDIGTYSDEAAHNGYILILVFGLAAAVVMIVIGVISIFVSRRLSRVIVKAILTPLQELDRASTKMKNGELDVEILYDSQDELGELARNFKGACMFMGEVIEDANHLLTEMAEGNFNIGTKKEEQYVGEFVKLIQAMRKMNRTLNETLTSINEGADQVSLGSDQMAESAVALAEGASEQAGAVEELTATIENVTESARNSADTADQYYVKVQDAVGEAEAGREDLSHLTDAMDRINATSMEIQNIIGAIEDIAAQTNLLSLNASIEAARAGEAGKGFAVVADQIGKLASESANSAIDTKELIAKALREVENGNQITEKTVAILENIIGSMSQFAELAKDTSENSNTQAELLNQVKEGIEQISMVVQSNSASAEETSATSEELAAQSESLKSLVSMFKLRDK